MKISVIIPAYNASATIGATVDSVLAQTHPADEILVMDDGSSDNTHTVLEAYGSKIKLFRQPNQGVAKVRNFLCTQVTGDLVAFLDSDDVWHPDYLKTQHEMLSRNPDAAAGFTAFLDSNQFVKTPWNLANSESSSPVEVMDPVRFFERYNYSPLQFPPSACCLPRSILNQMGNTPFPLHHDSVEDFGFMNTLPLFFKPLVRHPQPLVMYRLSPGSLSANRVKVMGLTIHLMEILGQRYQAEAKPELWDAFCRVFPSTRRNFAKFLMGAGKIAEARAQIRISLIGNHCPKSIMKSLGFLAISYFPARLQPKWPGTLRHQNF